MKALWAALLASWGAAACPVEAGFRVDAASLGALPAAWRRVRAATPGIRVTRVVVEAGAATVFATASAADLAAAQVLAARAEAAGAIGTQPPAHEVCVPGEPVPQSGLLQASAVWAAPVEPDSVAIIVRFAPAGGGAQPSPAARAFMARVARRTGVTVADADTMPPTEEAFLVAHGRMAPPAPAVRVETGALALVPAVEADARAAGAVAIERHYDVSQPATIEFLMRRYGPYAQRSALTLAHAAARLLGAAVAGAPVFGPPAPAGARGDGTVLAYGVRGTVSLPLQPAIAPATVEARVECGGDALTCLAEDVREAQVAADAVGLHAQGVVRASLLRPTSVTIGLR